MGRKAEAISGMRALALVILSIGAAAAGGLAAEAGAEPACSVHLRSLQEAFAFLPEMQRAIPDACVGKIRPGAAMNGGVCTLNFIFTDGRDLYTGTAGHCTGSVGQRIGTNGVGQFGSVVIDGPNGGANDFSLILIDADKHSFVDATLCAWGGPTGVVTATPGIGADAYEYGYGIATSSNPFTRSRAHALQSWTPQAVRWHGVGSGGDSGAPVVDDQGRALGIHTLGVTPVAGVVLEGGPSMPQILAYAAGQGYNLQVVAGGPFAGLGLP